VASSFGRVSKDGRAETWLARRRCDTHNEALFFRPAAFRIFAGPRRKYACCLNAIAMLLAHMANDSRQTREVRERAEKSLEAMTAQDILDAGLAGDFGEVCIRLDSHEHQQVLS